MCFPLLSFMHNSSLQLNFLSTSSCRSRSIKIEYCCCCDFIWLCSSKSSVIIIDSHSLTTVSFSPSCSSRTLSFSVDNKTSDMGLKSLLVSERGKRSFAACRACIQAFLSSSVSHLKCNVFVPLNIYNLLSSDLLARIDETLRCISPNGFHCFPAAAASSRARRSAPPSPITLAATAGDAAESPPPPTRSL
ncbi:Os12g0285650 [Oryza sativa Japonica Group]|uniref:Os12g0285650 protein n=1 Tax=Oryza sativa subsp. japonica TaxID=39947 RepID=A0A0P0Y956_ORYSJ|nr:hypothetical protein EE612_058957 [Oryza sativa]BAT16747.1 Os12g0285650 [Oryza sativa Japonica Group]